MFVLIVKNDPAKYRNRSAGIGGQGKAEPFSNHRCPAGNALGVHNALFRGFENSENAAMGRKTPFLDGHYFRPLLINASAMGPLNDGFGFFFFLGLGLR